MRAGVASRLHGWIIAGAELAVFLAPVAVAQFLPLYFYGALLAVFGVEIAGDCERDAPGAVPPPSPCELFWRAFLWRRCAAPS